VQFTLVAGDDTTDEDMFGAAGPDATTVHVGTGPSAASVALGTPAAFRALLALLAAARERASM
jgi:trehalose-6-phosphatase